tara:strand:+ start:853 stop:1065 length:213 start_codon:yes stop_codon:yes gene_type:complete
MGNMSYCRFENTAKDLEDCYDAIRSGETYEMETYEIDGLRQILNLSKQIIEMEDSINYAIKDSEEALECE